MADEQTGNTDETTSEEQQSTQQQPEPPHGDQDSSEQTSIDWKAEARKWEARAKSDHAKLTQLSPKASSADELAKKVDELSKTVDGYKREKQRSTWAKKVSAETGVDASLLTGDSLDAMREQGKRIAAWADAKIKATRPQGPIVPGVERQQTGSPQSSGLRALTDSLFGRN